MSYFDSAEYCNWLSKLEGLPNCYKRNKDGKFAEGMTVQADAVKQGGYRLPTEAEWEYACRAGTVTGRYYGHSFELLGTYESYIMSSGYQCRPCGLLLPNDFGLFDMMGNVIEWCHDRYVEYPKDTNEKTVKGDDIESETVTAAHRYVRGGSWRGDPMVLRSTTRGWFDTWGTGTNVGFRVVRTCP